MRFRFTRSLALLMVLTILCQMLTGCSSESSANNSYGTLNSETSANNSHGSLNNENVISEQFINEETIDEEKLQEAYIRENLIYESGIYEYKISENIISQAYIIEVVVGETSEEEILKQLPKEIDEYDIDWAKVIGKFAVGTVIIITVGIVNYFSKGSTYFVFGSPVKVAKDALVGGAIGVAMNEVIGCIIDGKIAQKAATKYAVEGFAEGYMWGAIDSVLKIFSKNFKRLNSFKRATGGKAKIKIDGSVFDDAGKYIGKAYYDKDGVWHLVNESSKKISIFDSAGKELKSFAGSSLPSNSKLRLGTDATAKICYTDDIGQIFRIGDDLLPNMRYQINGYLYNTDDLGRVTKIVADNLQLKNSTGRQIIFDSKSKIGRGFERHTDVRGHLIADRFGGDNTLANIVPMDGIVNNGEFKAIENILQKCLQDGGHVSVSIKPIYSGSSFRPDSLRVLYNIGNGEVTKIIPNG